MRRFLVSFVLVPGVLVLACLAIVVGFRWMTFSEPSPEQLVETIERCEGNARWRAAVHLAGLIGDPQNADLRQDHVIAGKLTEILRRELESHGGRKDDLMLQVYLCRALGEFNSNASLPVLIDAVGAQQDRDVRRSAIEAIALLVGTLGSERVAAEPGLTDSLLVASRDDDPQIRLSAAFALGVLGGQETQDRLTALLLDTHALVRYNAATGLARWGNAAAIDVLLEMLAPNQQPVIGNRADGVTAEVQQDLIHANALEAARQLMAANPEISAERFRAAVERLGKTTESPTVQKKVEEFQKHVSPRSP